MMERGMDQLAAEARERVGILERDRAALMREVERLRMPVSPEARKLIEAEIRQFALSGQALPDAISYYHTDAQLAGRVIQLLSPIPTSVPSAPEPRRAVGQVRNDLALFHHKWYCDQGVLSHTNYPHFRFADQILAILSPATISAEATA